MSGINAWVEQEEIETGGVYDLLVNDGRGLMTVKVLSITDPDHVEVDMYPGGGSGVDLRVVPVGDLRDIPVTVVAEDEDGGESFQSFRSFGAAQAFAGTLIDSNVHIESAGLREREGSVFSLV